MAKEVSKLPPTEVAFVTYGKSRLQEHRTIWKNVTGAASRLKRGIAKTAGLEVGFSVPAAMAACRTRVEGA